jgi:hydrogenase maturation protease
VKEILVLGIGSPLGADTLGWVVIDRLEEALKGCHEDSMRIELRKADRPGLALIEMLRPWPHAILVDAVVSGAPAGTLHHLAGDELPRSPARLSTHDAGVAEAIALGSAMNALPPVLELFGVEVVPDNPASTEAVGDLAERITRHLGC